ncbi:MAG: hypothetical protein K9L86_06555 [Candidatus Omnitrophica bacterium]|nr:hypothetical protein [Candidatus Omnitrophota bacterium]
MSKQYLLDPDGSFHIKDYNQAYPFSNFLPGISGAWGIPLWVFYVNRGQGVVSFGIKNKDHSIAEFFPANKAYSFVSSLGFRTFIKSGSSFYEPFGVHSAQGKAQDMVIKSDSFRIEESNPKLGLKTSVRYFTLSNTPVGGLVRVFTIKNSSKKNISLDVLDGLARIIPFGTTQGFLKEMSRTLEAWMQSSYQRKLAIFRLIVDPRDVSHTKYIEGANFNYSFYETAGKKIHPRIVVDPVEVFNHETSLNLPVNFLSNNFKAVSGKVIRGKTPCAFSHFKWKLAPGQERVLYSIFGSSPQLDPIRKFSLSLSAAFLKAKEKENEQIVESIKQKALTVSNLKSFDHYIQNSYLDNVLRGGYPYCATKNSQDKAKSIYYIYSRKHGDLERDYNNFQVLPTNFSEGEANYRDINQNRRSDLFFEPALLDKNLIYFLNFIKIDGYNPLLVRGEKLRLSKLGAKDLTDKFSIKSIRVSHLLLRGFYLGELFSLLAEEKINLKNRDKFLESLLIKAERKPQGAHTEGYWIDHWHYNLDLIESFLYFYPDRIKSLSLKKEFSFWDDEYRIRPRNRRYVVRSGKVYQGESIEAIKEKRTLVRKRKDYKYFLRTSKGKVYKTNLVTKLLSIILNKSATLDSHGIGIEMEADKPGWCDSLNGLPALFGSSICETLALKRAVEILLKISKSLRTEGTSQVACAYELSSFLKKIKGLLDLPQGKANFDYKFWDKSNSIKEDFRQKTFFTVSGREVKLSLVVLEAFLNKLTKKLDRSIEKAKDKKTGLISTYFTYEVTKYKPCNKYHVFPLAFNKNPLPLFLEGVVHLLRDKGLKSIYQKVKSSELFDKNLKMYRLNASLKDQSLEVGRSRAFAPGWLENESIWLHMEYKYLLELLKNGLYKEFFNDFKSCGVCFFDPKKYGRSTLENSSFIVSSSYPDKDLWARGFIARLSGATAEILNIWALLCLGDRPFFVNREKKLCFSPRPILRGEFFTTKKETVNLAGKLVVFPKDTFSFKLFSNTLVTYHNPNRRDTFGSKAKVKKIVVSLAGRKVTILSEAVPFSLSEDIRRGKADQIEVHLET